MVRPTVVLPQPDSPTRPSVSPSLMVKLTSSTACTQATTRCNKPAAHREILDQVLDLDKVLGAPEVASVRLPFRLLSSAITLPRLAGPS